MEMEEGVQPIENEEGNTKDYLIAKIVVRCYDKHLRLAHFLQELQLLLLFLLQSKLCFVSGRLCF